MEFGQTPKQLFKFPHPQRGSVSPQHIPSVQPALSPPFKDANGEFRTSSRDDEVRNDNVLVSVVVRDICE